MMYNDVQQKGVKAIEKPFEDFMTIDDVAKVLQVHRRTVWRWIRAGKLRAFKPGKEWRIDPRDFEKFMRESFPDRKE